MKLFVIAGPLMVLVGLAGLVLTVPVVQSSTGMYFLMMCFFMVMIGIGVGIGWPHLLTRVLTAAPAGESEKASASITTVQLLATAFGTALTGLVVNAAGITLPGGVQGAQQAAGWLFGLFTIMPILAIVVQLRRK